MTPRIPMGQGRMRHGQPASKAKNTKQTLLRIWRYIRKQWVSLIIVSSTVILSSVASVVGTYLIGIAIDKYVVNFDIIGLTRFSFFLMGVYLVSAVSTLLQSRIMVNVAQKAVADIRRDLFESLQNLPLSFFDSRPHGELMSKLTNDVDNMGQTLNQSLVNFISSLLTITMTLFTMIAISPPLAVVTVLIIPASMLITRLIIKYTRIYYLKQLEDLGELNGIIEETISGQKVVKVFGQEKAVIEKFKKKNDELRTSGVKAMTLSGMIMPAMGSLNNLSFALIALTGGWLLLKGFGGLTIGRVANMLTYSKQFGRPINEIATLFNTIQSAIAGAERVFEVMDEPKEPVDGKLINKDEFKGNVVFDNVTFAYKKGENVLENVNITAKPGSIVALVGPTGAGKTTIVNLLTRFYDVDEGAILIDGDDIRTLDRSSLRQRLGMVLQDTYLFSASIRENIRYGRLDATDEEVENAARLANVHRFISHLPEGYDTIISDSGEGLSQGQRQLIAIARVILADPSILILDEATSSIDTRTEKHIQQALLTLMKGRTSFVIAHRLSTIRDADEILVINNGRIIERGNHKSLFEQGGFYYGLYTSQFKRINGIN
ncbi:MAG: putative ABC transporter ATP-binding protein [Firmicutes bacterium ADurb.Bin193]|nr:MAG: putative ABC transporter ATP-binding protein [Firmicutes bacterium ADurb.Bin193]